MEKNPVSMLQEIMIKHGSVPIYEEIRNTQGINTTSFVIRVKCKDQSVDGMGLNKKAAKSNAAAKMLKLLMSLNTIPRMRVLLPMKQPSLMPTVKLEQHCSPLHAIQSCSPIKTVQPVASVGTVQCIAPAVQTVDTTLKVPTPEEPCINYVGKLKEYCEVNRELDAIYTFVEDTGPPHCRTFKARCTAMSLKEEASGRTKKQAKQAVAKKMLEQITLPIGPVENSLTLETSNKAAADVDLEKLEVKMMNLKVFDPPIQSATEKAVMCDRYKQMTNRSTSSKNVQICEYHVVLKDLSCRTLQAKKESLIKFCQLKNFYCYRINEIKEVISTAWKVKLQKIVFRTNNSKQCIVGFRLDTLPPMLEVGVGDTNEIAEMTALVKLLKLFFIYMK